MSSSNCCFLTCIKIFHEAGQVVWYSHLLKNFQVCCDPHSQRFWHSQKSRNRCFSETLLLFQWSSDVGNLISGSSTSSKTSLNIWKFMVHVLLKPGLENFEHYFVSVWDECNCAIVWAFTTQSWTRLSDWTELLTPTAFWLCFMYLLKFSLLSHCSICIHALSVILRARLLCRPFPQMPRKLLSNIIKWYKSRFLVKSLRNSSDHLCKTILPSAWFPSPTLFSL